MDRNYNRIGLINWIALLAATTVTVLVSRYVNSTAGWITSVVLGISLLVSLIGYFQMWLEERERVEKLEFDEVNKVKGSEALFSGGVETLSAQRSREQFERFFVPVFTVILFLIEGAAVYWHWKYLEKDAKPLVVDRALMAASLFGLMFLVLFLLGKFSARLAQIEKQRFLRASSGYVLLSAYVCLLLSVTIAVGAWVTVPPNVPQPDLLFARILTVVLGLIAIETLLALLLEMYRPRVKGKVDRVLYESRLVGLLGQPEGVFETAAQALKYQFGFDVSETWFFKFIRKWVFVLIAVQVGILLVSTMFVFIETGEEALLERFGQPIKGREVLGAGVHVKLPFPIDRVHRYRTEQIQSFIIGAEKEDEEHKNPVITWSVAHEKEENMLVASREVAARETDAADAAPGKKSPPVNLLSVSIPVQYQITNLAAWAYNNVDGNTLLTNLALREVVQYLVSADLNEMMSQGRALAAEELRKRLQSAADARQLGARIVFVGLQDIHPPVAVAAEYENVVGMTQKSQAKVLEAKAFQIQTNALARATAASAVNRAEADRQRAEVSSLARAALFTNQIPAYEAVPEVYAQRAYLRTLARGSEKTRKYVIGTTNTQDVIQFDLQDKFSADMLDIVIPGPKK